MAEVERRNIAEVAENTLEDAVLGKIHTYRLGLKALKRSGEGGRDGE
jgi:hypothetical protein